MRPWAKFPAALAVLCSQVQQVSHFLSSSSPMAVHIIEVRSLLLTVNIISDVSANS